MPLEIEDFSAFFRAVHNVEPFPWQTRLVAEVMAKSWPEALDIPTSCGKTAALDVAVFALAMEAHKPITHRRAPLRICFVVDRRLIVDDAFTRASRILSALEHPSTKVVQRVADCLRRLAEEGHPPLSAVRLRGGLPREPDWARTPSQPTVLVSTVDQVGSRLLFRGYGVSDSMKPIHAGLLGADALILLDEAHLSQPFLQTLRDLAAPPWKEALVAPPFSVVSLSATQVGNASFCLDPADRAHPELSKRLTASKSTSLVLVKADSDDQEFVDAFAQHACSLSSAGSGTAHVQPLWSTELGGHVGSSMP